MEVTHDYIQCSSPWPEPSGFNAAPVLNRESIQEFRTRPDLQDKLRVSFLRMINFYGLEVRSGERTTVNRAQNFATKATVWVSPGNHNHLRITRILRCLSVLGLEAEAKAFFDCLVEICEGEQNEPMSAISDETMLYWREAVSDAGSGLGSRVPERAACVLTTYQRHPAYAHRTGRESLSQHPYSEHRRRRFPASTRLLSLLSRPRRTSTRSRTTNPIPECF